MKTISGPLNHLEKRLETQITDRDLEKVFIYKNKFNASAYLYKVKFWLSSLNQQATGNSVIGVFKDGQ